MGRFKCLYFEIKAEMCYLRSVIALEVFRLGLFTLPVFMLS